MYRTDFCIHIHPSCLSAPLDPADHTILRSVPAAATCFSNSCICIVNTSRKMISGIASIAGCLAMKSHTAHTIFKVFLISLLIFLRAVLLLLALVMCRSFPQPHPPVYVEPAVERVIFHFCFSKIIFIAINLDFGTNIKVFKPSIISAI